MARALGLAPYGAPKDTPQSTKRMPLEESLINASLDGVVYFVPEEVRGGGLASSCLYHISGSYLVVSVS